MKQIYGRQVVMAACRDIERCYSNSADMRIRIEFNARMRGHIAFSGNTHRARIRVSKDFCQFKITTAAEFVYVLIQVAHEIAHYLNKHNDHSDEGEADTKALETWADFFGARVFMLLISFNTKTRKQLQLFSIDLEQNQVLLDIGAGLRQVYDFVYLSSPSDLYPESRERVQIFVAGVCSFFMRVFAEFKGEWTQYVFVTIMRDSGLFDVLNGNDPNFDEHKSTIDRSMEIQQRLQGMRHQITPGLKRVWEPLIGTNYDLSPQQVERNRKNLIAIVENAGFNLSGLRPNNA